MFRASQTLIDAHEEAIAHARVIVALVRADVRAFMAVHKCPASETTLTAAVLVEGLDGVSQRMAADMTGCHPDALSRAMVRLADARDDDAILDQFLTDAAVYICRAARGEVIP